MFIEKDEQKRERKRELLLPPNLEAVYIKGKVIILKGGCELIEIPKTSHPHTTTGKVFTGSDGGFCKLKTIAGCDQHPDSVGPEFELPIDTIPVNMGEISLLEIL